MAARLTLAAMCFSLAAGVPGDGLATCLFNDFGDITNPNDPSCRDVQLRYTRDDDSGNSIALGYDVPRPIGRFFSELAQDSGFLYVSRTEKRDGCSASGRGWS